MFKWITLAGALVLSTCATSPVTAQSNSACSQRTELIEDLTKEYGEVIVAIGLTERGAQVLEILVSPEGTWTTILSYPNGTACMLGSGTDWIMLKPEEILKGEKS